ncbi:MAG: NYN domain-containing protein [Chromatiales bacterium]|nr:NYN domain-containing protein [Chromatiales bacterium]
MSNSVRIGVFVDAENIRLNGGYQMRYDTLRRFAARDGGVLLRMNTYMNFDPQRAKDDAEYARNAQFYQQTVREFGWKVIVKNVKRYVDDDGNINVKANSDLDLAIDAMQQVENLDQVLLVTGDGDFLGLVGALQNRGVRVELLAFRNISSALKRQVDAFHNGYLVPNLLPFVHEPHNEWGAPGGCVRGVCTKWFTDKGFGFLRFIRQIDSGLWITDARDPNSPYEPVFCHANELASPLTTDDMLNRDNIVEFYLNEPDSTHDGRMSANNVRLVDGPARVQSNQAPNGNRIED